MLHALRNFAALFPRVEAQLRERGDYYRGNAGRFYCGLDGIDFVQRVGTERSQGEVLAQATETFNQVRAKALQLLGEAESAADVEPLQLAAFLAPRALRLSGAGATGSSRRFAVAIGVGLLAYPYLLEALLARFGVRASARRCSRSASRSARGPRPRVRSRSRSPAWPGLLIAAVLVAGALSGQRGALLLVPAIVYLGVADLFRSEPRPRGLDPRARRALVVPEAPDFIRCYCRGVTWLWVGLLARERRRDRRRSRWRASRAPGARSPAGGSTR